MLGWELPPYNSGGLGVACLQMAKALAGRGVDIEFVLPYRAVHPKAETFMKILSASNVPPLVDENGNYVAMGAYSGCCGRCQASRHCRHAKLYGQGFVAATRQYADSVEQLVKRRRLKPHIIHTHDWLTMEAGRRAKMVTGSPLIVHVHATEFDRAGGTYGNPLIHEIEYQGLVAADRIIAVSQITKDIIVRQYQIPADKIEVIHNSLDPDELTRTTVKTNNYVYAKKLKDNGWTVVSSMARLTIMKGFTYLLEAAAMAMKRNPKLLFIIGGSGEQRNELIELSADLGISERVIFTDFVRGAKRRELYEISDIFVMSSISEPFGLTALEAAHYDSAVVISKQAGVGELLNYVMRFDYWDTRKLADAIINISLSPALSHELKDGIRAEYLRFSWDDAAQKLTHQYDRLMRRQQPTTRLEMEAIYA
jgi:glycosyltransferase involved in cell wall biosynthesis